MQDPCAVALWLFKCLRPLVLKNHSIGRWVKHLSIGIRFGILRKQWAKRRRDDIHDLFCIVFDKKLIAGQHMQLNAPSNLSCHANKFICFASPSSLPPSTVTGRTERAPCRYSYVSINSKSARRNGSTIESSSAFCKIPVGYR
jgi:hypothetical protein